MGETELKHIAKGWLMIPTLQLLIGVIIYGFFVFGFLRTGEPSLFFIIYSGLLILAIVGIKYESNAKKEFPEIFIVFAWASAVIGFLLGNLLGIANAIIWTIYMKKSERVKKTFVK